MFILFSKLYSVSNVFFVIKFFHDRLKIVYLDEYQRNIIEKRFFSC